MGCHASAEAAHRIQRWWREFYDLLVSAGVTEATP